MKARIAEADKSPGVFAQCLMAWSRGEEGVDADAAAFTLANVLLQLRAVWVQKK